MSTISEAVEVDVFKESMDSQRCLLCGDSLKIGDEVVDCDGFGYEHLTCYTDEDSMINC